MSSSILSSARRARSEPRSGPSLWDDLRPPLETLLILAEHLEENRGDTMTDLQVTYACAIHRSGSELLDLLESRLHEAGVEPADIGGPPTGALAAPDPARDRQPARGHDYNLSAIDGLRILVVDDDYRNAFAMTAFLERGGAAVTVVESGERAIATLDRSPGMDVVLMDVAMPGLDGYETTRAIRSTARFRALPIIAVSGRVEDRTRQSCIDSGANDFVPKPVDTAELLAALMRWGPVGTPCAA
jgi:CheY-like chemotaxis protein